MTRDNNNWLFQDTVNVCLAEQVGNRLKTPSFTLLVDFDGCKRFPSPGLPQVFSGVQLSRWNWTGILNHDMCTSRRGFFSKRGWWGGGVGFQCPH